MKKPGSCDLVCFDQESMIGESALDQSSFRETQGVLRCSHCSRLQLENHSDRPAPYHFVNMDNQKGRSGDVGCIALYFVSGESL